MRINTLSFLATLFLLFGNIYVNAQSWVWAKRAGGTIDDYALATTTNDSGNVYVTGWYMSSSITFGSTTLLNAATGYEDLYVVKYSSTGTVLWAKKAGAEGRDRTSAIATDDSGNVYITGSYTSGSITFGAITLSNPTGSFYFKTGFIVKYKSNGTVIWAKNIGFNNNDEGNAVSCDHFGHVYVAGQFTSDSISFGSGVVVRDTAPGTADVFIAKLTTAGTPIWAKKFGYTMDDAASSIDVSTSGDIYIAGIFKSPSITIGTTTIPNVTPASGVSDVFITRLDSNGNVIWAKGGGGSWYDEANSISINNATGDVYVTGDFNGTGFSFGTTSVSNSGASYTYDMYVMKLNSSGVLTWLKHPTGGFNEYGKSLVTDASGNIYVAGAFTSTSMTIGSSIVNNPYSTWSAILVARFNPAGALDFATAVSAGSGNDWANSIALDTSGDIYICGGYESPLISFDTITLGNASTYQEMYVARMHYVPTVPPPAPITGLTAICAGSTTTLSDTSSGGTWSSSNISVATVGSVSGIVTGTGAGTATITYSTSSGTSTIVVTVSAPPPPITSATFSICLGGTTALADAVTGGTWSSGSPTIATVGSVSGIVNGVGAGTCIITYFHSGCYSTAAVTVNTLPNASFSGTYIVCAGHAVTLTATTSGGTWTSTNPSIGTVGATSGVVTGVAVGTTTIKYKLGNSCGIDSAVHIVTVTPAASCSTAVLVGELNEYDLQVYPNPNQGTFALKFNCRDEALIDIVITNILGTRVGQYKVAANEEVNINLGQPAGVYIISATSNQSSSIARVLIE